ncbi:DNA replication complex GINS protein PSF3 isoform X1 [Trichosurus vulpecula]|uniref:DNA replication complex GINS protein PSF3 isoform X1 n=1 Tax=Trichosurus vulpecula TaxID=9337 RepID=UPI00186AC590|nr:DNA replication complex GINS protein PSF3 isoform X1 [Trichosurus vulpecula]
MSEAYFPVESGALGPEENFLSLDDILMSHEKLPARTETLLPRLGGLLLERSSGGESELGIPEVTPPTDVSQGLQFPAGLGSQIGPLLPPQPLITLRLQGSKLEIPLWLAKGLYDNKRRILSVELPKIYKEGWRTVFSADANVVDLHKMGPHYYAFGSQLLHFDSPENPEVSQTLLQTFIGRFRRIMDSSQNAYNEDTSSLVARLDELERGLFRTGQKGLNDFQCWEKGQASQITASSLVQNYKKRKFTDLEG